MTSVTLQCKNSHVFHARITSRISKGKEEEVGVCRTQGSLRMGDEGMAEEEEEEEGRTNRVRSLTSEPSFKTHASLKSR